jgi:hypothetical protein
MAGSDTLDVGFDGIPAMPVGPASPTAESASRHAGSHHKSSSLNAT